MKNSSSKQTFKSFFIRKIPFFINNFERYILFEIKISINIKNYIFIKKIWNFIWRSTFENYKTIFRVFCRLHFICRSRIFINQFRIKYIEFISLYNFWWRVVLIIMSSIIHIPKKSSFYSVKVLWLFWLEFINPIIILFVTIKNNTIIINLKKSNYFVIF